VAAAKATAGVVLSSDGVNVFFAEYAANTNGLYCPDGQAGQPAQNWPCMLDPIATGSTGSGHGRGMSQWGSQYWARGQSYQGLTTTRRDWRCILNHYYNANSNGITVDPNYTGPGSIIAGTAGTQNRTAFLQNAPTYGNIAYESFDSKGFGQGIRVAAAADGSGDHLLVSGNDSYPAWEPGGSRLAYADGNWGISVINADGSGQRTITTNANPTQWGGDYAPAWSLLGDKIAFCSSRSGAVDIWVVNPDGTGLKQITFGAFISEMAGEGYDEEACYVRWSPDGTKIAFTGDTAYVPFPGIGTTWEVYTANSDGSAITQLTNCQINDPQEAYQSLCGTPSWSPDGTKIAFFDGDTPFGDNIGGGGIYTMTPVVQISSLFFRTKIVLTTFPSGPTTANGSFGPPTRAAIGVSGR